ncbi:hypothetical protein SAMN04488034_101936 [Salinimicrobium catena]|uniref:Uncharacterized protein n=1 Tax=Salinimicrobium catena TaxID=390640 RepID=A0A1H5K2K6_9FLAO|nr:hypothetical protein [Salinimicrobium catena]SDK92638.1 hypothetical protein SAMN04488140_101923 [Salinimicrobium catena]SEE58351.1 hypothetical protein SAMN04488034_101936 [Salinimicrobium catena]
MRKILVALLIALLTGCSQDYRGLQDPVNYISENSAVILKLQDPDLFFSNLKNNELIKKNSDFPLIQDLEKKLSLLNYFPHNRPAYLALALEENKDLKFAFLSTEVPQIETDSIKNKMVETFNTKDHQIKKYTLEGQVAYTSSVDSIYIFSNSKSLLESSLSGNPELANSEAFQKAMKASSDKQPGIFVNHKKLEPILNRWFPQENLDHILNFSNWTSLDAELSQSAIKLNGISISGDTLPHHIDLFKGVGTSENMLPNITPSEAKGLYSVTFDKFAALKENLTNFRRKDPKKSISKGEELLEIANEAGLIYLAEGNVLAIRVLDREAAKIALSAHQEELEDFREISIYNYSGNFEILKPLLTPGALSVYAYLDEFVLFSDSFEAIKKVISDFQNEQVMSKSEAYQASFESLSTKASILLLTRNSSFKNDLSEAVSEAHRNATKGLDFKNYPLTALQFIYNGNFAHVHAVLTKKNETKSENTASQTVAIHLDAALATRPVFFKNHRTKGNDIAVQDVNNVLYLISPEGKIYWKKQLESRILGEIESVDILRNGRYQLAFATQNRLHVIDRTGRTVKPFPLEFNDEITQPLAVFDYDNKRKYRFVIVQDRELYMFNNKGERVRGFTFSKADATITQSPKHIRIGRKDYILVPETSGKLNILSRTGRPRVGVKEKLNFSDNEWYEYENEFASTSASGELLKIDESGKVQKKKLGLSENHKIDATIKTLATMSENILTIKDNEVSLDFGLYTAPEIFYIDNKIYVSVTDLQAHKVYLFDSNGQLLPGFPLYGNSRIDLSKADANSIPDLVVQGEDDSVLVYEIN